MHLPLLKTERPNCGRGTKIHRLPKYMEHPGHKRLERAVRQGKTNFGIKVQIKYKDGATMERSI